MPPPNWSMCGIDRCPPLLMRSPRWHREVPGNLSGTSHPTISPTRFQKGDRVVVDAAVARAAHVVDIEIVNNRLIIAPIETRAAIGTVQDGSLHTIDQRGRRAWHA